MIDFIIPAPLLGALVIALLQPLYLFLVTRVPALAGRNGLQFVLAAAIAFALWMAFVRPSGAAETALALMALAGPLLVYLEIWGLMSRGYTLGLLLTLFRAGRPLSAAEIRDAYRGGDGLDWIMRHRLGAMLSTGVVTRDGDRVALTPVRGALVARLYLLGVMALGLRRTG